MSEMKILDKAKLGDFLKSLSGFEVIGPITQNDNLLFGDLSSASVEADFKGRPSISPKEYFFPQREKIFTFDTTNKVNVDVKSHLNTGKRAIWGIRPCDLAGIKSLDTIFLSNYVDTYYQARRKNTVLMGLNCNEPCETGFCASYGTGPFAAGAFDVMFTDIGGKYLVNIGSKAGGEVVNKNPKLFTTATAADEAKSSELEKKSKKAFMRSIDAKAAKEKLPKAWDDPVWKEEAANCMLCGGCNFVCPTCHCFNIEDVAQDGEISTRIRYWDSCQLGGFTQMAAENTRHAQSERLRQRIFHKCVYIPDKYNGVPGCTGCGRCIEVCPASIDITNILGRITSK